MEEDSDERQKSQDQAYVTDDEDRADIRPNKKRDSKFSLKK